jgi:hypothetical protein
MPIVGLLTGGIDFTKVRNISNSYTCYWLQAKAAGAAVITYGI